MLSYRSTARRLYSGVATDRVYSRRFTGGGMTVENTAPRLWSVALRTPSGVPSPTGSARPLLARRLYTPRADGIEPIGTGRDGTSKAELGLRRHRLRRLHRHDQAESGPFAGGADQFNAGAKHIRQFLADG